MALNLRSVRSLQTPEGNVKSIINITNQAFWTTTEYKTYWVALPNEYQRVEYIQTSGSGSTAGSYLDLGLVPDTNTELRLLIDCNTEVSTSVDNIIFGTNSNKYYGMRWYNKKMYFGTKSKETYKSYTSFLRDGTFILFNDLQGHRARINTTALQSLKTDYTANGSNLYLGYRSVNPIYGSWKYYECVVSKGDVTLRHLIPCYKKSDNEIGMYDVINDVFYTNAGTGALTKGANVY